MALHYENRIKGILETLRQERYTGTFRVPFFYKKDIGYGMRQVMEEDYTSWEHFTPEQTWGGREVHSCFQTELTIPTEWKGKTVVAQVLTGVTDIWNTDNPQFIAYVDGTMVCAVDMNHSTVVLRKSAEGGETIRFGLYAYSNSPEQNVFLKATVSVLQTDVEKLYYDMKVPYETAVLLKEEDARRLHLIRLLNEAVNRLDLRDTASEAFHASVGEASAYLQRELYDKETAFEAVVHSIGHTHIDVAWKWPLRQTREKVLRSFLTVLSLMDRYPEYKFMSSQPQLYQFVKEDAPEVYEQIKKRGAEGRWETEGAMWLEADCNLTSGESLIRQIIYGKRFFKEEFGKGDNKVLWLPDVFGYSAALPQILKKTGISYFMTTKIGWNEYNKIPHDTMYWQGIDGSEVLTHFITTRDYRKDPELDTRRDCSTTYNGRQNASQVMGTWQRYQDKAINNEVLTCYGHGDGGGGTTPEMLEESRRMHQGIPGCPRVEYTFCADYFKGLEERLKGKRVPKWCGELYLEFHRGTYTSMARNKKYNRLAENRNQAVELFSVLRGLAEEGAVYPKEELRHVWELTLLNQFHDILPGSSIKEVYEDSRAQYEEILKTDDRLIEQALSGLEATFPKEKEALLVYNTTSFARTELIITKEQGRKLYGNGAALQKAEQPDGTTCYLVPFVPPKGYVALTYEENGEDGIEERSAQPLPLSRNDGMWISADCKQVETPYYRVLFNDNAELCSLYDKEAKRELVQKGEAAGVLLAYEDRPLEYDAWNIDDYYTEKCWHIDGVEEWRLLSADALSIRIYVKRRFMESVLEQTIVFYAHTRRIDYKTTIDWRQSQILLKAAFPVDIQTTKATYEIQYGNVERPTHENTSWDEARFEVCAHRFADLSEPGYGVALLNDCKYGYDIHGSVMRLTLLKSGNFPYDKADQEKHEFTYALFPHQGDFRNGRVVPEAYALNAPLFVRPVKRMPKQACYSMLTSGNENVIIEVIKQAEETKALVVRLYEAYGMRTRTTLTGSFAAEHVYECDMLEQTENELVLKQTDRENAGFVVEDLEFKPYEIKTLLFTGKQ